MRTQLSNPTKLLPLFVLLLGLVPPCRGQDIEVTKDPTHRWGENNIVVNPKNPENLVIATVGTGFTKDCREHSPACQLVMADFGVGRPFPQAKGIFTVADFNVVAAIVSFDRGKTWKSIRIPVTPADHPDLTGAGDPSVAATADGTFYFSFDDTNWGTPGRALPDAGVAVSKSTDGGTSWSTPVLTGTPIDGPKMTADTSTGKIYEASSTLLGPHSTGDAKSAAGKEMDRWLVSSKDGLHWTAPQAMGGVGMSMSAAHGVLATAFEASVQPTMFSAPNAQLCGGKKAPCVIFETTTDAGKTWTRHVLPGPASASNAPDSQPMVAADPSKRGQFAVAVPINGREYHVYRTHDAGQTWQGPVGLTEDVGKTHYHSAMAYSEKGVLAIMWQTAQSPPGQSAMAAPAGGPGGGPAFPYNVWAAISRDGGTSFSAPLKISSAESPAPPSDPFGNAGDDYSSIAVSGNHVYVTWADWRSQERANFFRDVALEDFNKQR
jgi:hypothetical protein